MASEFFISEHIILKEGNPLERDTVITWGYQRQPGLYCDGQQHAIDSTKKYLETAPPDVLGVRLLGEDDHTCIIIPRVEYAHRFQT